MNKRLRFFCSFAVLNFLLLPCLAAAEDPSYQQLADHFFEILKQGKGVDAVVYLTGTNPELSKVPDQIEKLKTGFGSLGSTMGGYVSSTKLIETRVADIFIYQHYLVAYDKQPISVRMQFYKPGGKWVCYALQFDNDLTDLIQKQADSNLRFSTQY